MMQELLSGNNVGIISNGEKPKLSSSPSPSPNSPSLSPSPTTTSENNLRCPRCDSANTKFCYYNNYNLTQPRHFCKTCRRYWTKGGSLRNVPIGGGCRKNKSTSTITSPAVKLKTISQDLMNGKSGGLFNGFDQTEISTNPMLWPNNSHLLSLLRSNPNPNPNPNPNSNPYHISVKDEGLMFGSSESNGSGLNGLQVPSINGLMSNSYYRSNQGILLGEVHQSNGIQELYSKLRVPTTSFPELHNTPLILGNMASATTSTSAILDSAPVAAAGEFGFWNPNFSWPADLSTTTNGAYH